MLNSAGISREYFVALKKRAQKLKKEVYSKLSWMDADCEVVVPGDIVTLPSGRLGVAVCGTEDTVMVCYLDTEEDVPIAAKLLRKIDEPDAEES